MLSWCCKVGECAQGANEQNHQILGRPTIPLFVLLINPEGFLSFVRPLFLLRELALVPSTGGTVRPKL